MKIKNIQNFLNKGCEKQTTEVDIWFVQIGKIECKLKISTRSHDNLDIHFKSGWRGFFAMHDLSMKIESGSFKYKKINVMMMAKLQAFIDKSLLRKNKKDMFKSDCSFSLVEIPDSCPTLYSRREIEYWLLDQALNPKLETNQFINLLRSTEWYLIVHFLLSEFNGNNKLKDLCQRYGLSLSHFRRICRVALGNTTKIALRDWRMVRAILALVIKNQNLTEVAFNNGYASLSHFSNEVKENFGVSPKELFETITNTTNQSK